MAAPIEMAWEGKSIGEICRQIKDPDRNGGRNLSLLREHLAHDDLVAWCWQPGEGRDPAPGSQALLGELIQAWIDTRAQCPLGRLGAWRWDLKGSDADGAAPRG